MAVKDTPYTAHFLEVCPVSWATTEGVKGRQDFGLGGVSSMPGATSRSHTPLGPKVCVLTCSLHPGSGRLHSLAVALIVWVTVMEAGGW